MSIQSILVAVDFGDASARAVAAGGAIAAHCPGAALRLLHAESIEAPAYFTAEQVGDLERQLRPLISLSWGRTDAMVPNVGGSAHSRSASNYGKPLVLWCTVPILFVPETQQRSSL